MSDRLLTLLCPPTVEEKLLDELLLLDQVQVFTSAPTAAHGVDNHLLDASEQVMGRARAVAVQAVVREDDAAALLANLRDRFRGTGLRYWITPVLESGELK